MSIFCLADDKYVPIYRIQWISANPHFCGEEDCCREGQYEIRLEQGESVWARTVEERDQVIRAVEAWSEGRMPDNDESSAW